MQDLLDKHLDEDISRTLKFETTLTPKQKAAAWERLQARVQEQTQLPPLEEPCQPELVRFRWLEMITAFRVGSTKLLHTLVMDSAAFERAGTPKSLFPCHYYDIHGRWTHLSIIAMSA